MNDHLRGLVAVMVVLSTVGGAAMIGPHVGGPVGEASQSISPVGSADALGVTGALLGGIVVGTVACDTVIQDVCDPNTVDADELNKTDALETHKAIHETTSTQAQNNNNINTAFGNYLQDTESIAKMEGKNAYIRALENGSGEAAALDKAHQAVADYYSNRQVTMRTQWETTVEVLNQSYTSAESQAGMNPTDIIDTTELTNNEDEMAIYKADSRATVTLVNGSSVEMDQIYVDQYGGGAGSVTATFIGGPVTPTWADKTYGSIEHLKQRAPTSNLINRTVVDFTEWNQTWHEIEDKNDAVQSEVSNFVSQTYDGYQQGEINTTDLIDPYLASRDYSPDSNYGTWALRSFASMGYAPPSDLENVGSMKVTWGGTTREGILLSDGVPADGNFSVGTTYNTSDLAGKQLLMDEYDGTTDEIQGVFTIDSATDMDGNNKTAVTYETVDYDTADLSEFKQLNDELRNLTREINDRQDELRSGGNGGIGLPPLGLGVPDWMVYGGAALVALFAWSKANEDDEY